MNNPGGIKGGIANAIFSIRPLILLIFVIGTAVMAFYMAQLRVDSGFKKQLPLEHEYMQTFQFYEEFGGANRILVALMDEDGDMFDPEFFRAFEQISNRSSCFPASIGPAFVRFSRRMFASWRSSRMDSPAAT